MNAHIVLLLLTFSLVRASSNDDFVTPSGRTLSRNEVISRLPTKIRSQPHRFVYDISEDNVLHGPEGFRLDLASLTYIKPVSLSPWLPFYVDGVKRSIGKPTTFIHTDNEYYAVLHGESKRLTAFYGRNITLHPLDIEKFPTVFRNALDGDFEEADVHPPPHDEPEDFILNAPDQPKPVPNIQTFTADNGGCAVNQQHNIEISVAFDTTFCTKYGGFESTLGTIQAMFDVANIIFERDTCAKIFLVHLEGYCSGTDPYQFIDTSYSTASGVGKEIFIIQQFQSFYTTNRANVRRDVAYFFHAFEDHGRALGVAYVGRTCPSLTNFAVGWVESFRPDTFAHEIGHNLNCPHTGVSGGVMSTVRPREFKFADSSVTTITNYIDTSSFRSCITRDDAICDATCPNNCVDGKCVAPPTQAPPPFVPCSPLSNYFCTFPYNGMFILTNCPTGNYVIRTFDPTDGTITCCRDTRSQESATTFIAPRNGDPYRPTTYFGNSATEILNAVSATVINTEVVPCVAENSPSRTPTPSPTSSTTPSQSSTTSPSSTSSPSLSSSAPASFTLTVSPSASPSLTSTASTSSSSTVTASSSTSISPTSSTTPMITITVSSTISPTITASATLSSPPSITVSPTITTSASPTSSSTTASPSVSQTTSPSISISVTPSLGTVTPSITATTSSTISSSPSLSIIPSITLPSSPSISPTMSPSAASASSSISPTMTTSSSVSAPSSQSIPIPASSQPSSTPSQSASSSASPSASKTPSSTSSPSLSSPPSTSPIASSTSSTSTTPTFSMSSSPSMTLAPSTSASASRSLAGSPTLSPSASHSVSKSPAPSKSTSTSPSATSSPSTVSLADRTCSFGFTNVRHISCRTRLTRNLRLNGGRRLRLIVNARFGEFRYVLKGLGYRISSFAVVFSTASSVPQADFDAATVSLDTPRVRINNVYGTKIEDIPLTPPVTTCCGKTITMFVRANLCKGRTNNCIDAEFSTRIRVRCKPTCRRNRNRFIGVPMSDSRRCPRCIPIV